MKAIICGAGITGLAAANRLSDIGWEVVVVEKAPGPRPQGYMIDFFGPGFEATQHMGLQSRVRELGYHVKTFAYVDEEGRTRASVDYTRFAKVLEGHIVSILRPDIELALRESVEDSVDLRYGTRIETIANSADGVRVGLTDGTTVDGDLLIGADGIHSQTRDQVFGPESDYLRYLGFHTGAYIFDDPEIHQLVGDGFYLTDTVDKQMGFYGLRGTKVAVFTVHRTDDPALPADSQAAVRDAYRDLGWIAQKALAACPGSHEVYYDQVAQIEMPQWIDKRVVLLGDSSYAVSLMAGQGASLGIAGAYVMARLIDSTPDLDAALARFQERWHPVVTERQRVARRGISWFLPHSPSQLTMRRWAIKAMKLPGLDRYLGKAFLGKSHVSVQSLSEA
ncbi:MAG TPA: FAD-dependent monooxygenase [Stackebrandtia sp.]|jgi:2-polyprenyl-6-methoxyphenol hydroxylase-like FAD-dependent oxidoreductase|uniref:FAD-dependent monooxygenase n=1 Tax=Stackebrandtia sp. TaxID=2023065 RepID=UPI002D4D7595|nr:FAD-dependent monooxygenase [Stackebrandtia sp.]HZE39479.1 FAD-dependent monooxygenase [Stackebrandtia sp.]